MNSVPTVPKTKSALIRIKKYLNECYATYKTVKMKFWFYKNERGLFVFYVISIICLLYNTGIVSDDYSLIMFENRFSNFFDSLVHGPKHEAKPVFRYIFGIYYYFIDIDQFILIDFIKILINVSIFYMTTKFFSLFLRNSSSMLIAFLFIFFPTHDSTTYGYHHIALSLCIGLYLYAYYLVSNNRFTLAGISSLLASFVHYGSPPIAFSLFVLCLYKKTYKQGLILFIPNIAYGGYFIFVTMFLNQGVQRIPSGLNVVSLIKQYVLQVGSFIDAAIGPSFFFKIYYSIIENDITSIVLAIIFVIGYVFISLSNDEEEKVQVDKNLLMVLIILILTSFVIFAMTGAYPQLAFNLGNRTTIFGSLLIAYLIVILPKPKIARNVILIVLLASITGISLHWKQWNLHQQEIIKNIQNNHDLASYKGEDPIYVTGNQYSKMGPFSHIEFLSEIFVVNSIFSLAVHESPQANTLNKRFRWKNGILIDNKYNEKHFTGNSINVYDSKKDKLLNIPSQEINSYINTLPNDKRHWIQFIENKKIKAMLVKLMPRLKYIFLY